jgi:hypothetical protein
VTCKRPQRYGRPAKCPEAEVKTCKAQDAGGGSAPSARGTGDRGRRRSGWGEQPTGVGAQQRDGRVAAWLAGVHSESHFYYFVEVEVFVGGVSALDSEPYPTPSAQPTPSRHRDAAWRAPALGDRADLTAIRTSVRMCRGLRVSGACGPVRGYGITNRRRCRAESSDPPLRHRQTDGFAHPV